LKSQKDTSIWTNKPIKLAIAVPTKDMVHSEFAFSLTQLIKTTENVGIETYLFFNSSTILLTQREKLTQQSMDVGADYILWLDSDMTFPSTSALRLLSHNLDVVGCNYKKRSIPQTTVAYKKMGDWESHVSLNENEPLIEVEGVGMGCLLIKTKIFYDLIKPYFIFTYNHETDDWLGEDFNLQKKFRDKGYKIFIDTQLSKELTHLGTYKYGISNQ
jgi:hypothetical protein